MSVRALGLVVPALFLLYPSCWSLVHKCTYTKPPFSLCPLMDNFCARSDAACDHGGHMETRHCQRQQPSSINLHFPRLFLWWSWSLEIPPLPTWFFCLPGRKRFGVIIFLYGKMRCAGSIGARWATSHCYYLRTLDIVTTNLFAPWLRRCS
jgi:hypothetical protein